MVLESKNTPACVATSGVNCTLHDNMAGAMGWECMQKGAE